MSIYFFFLDSVETNVLILQAVETTTSGGLSFHFQKGQSHYEYLISKCWKEKLHLRCVDRTCNARLILLSKVRILEKGEKPNITYELDKKDKSLHDNQCYTIQSHKHNGKCKSKIFFKLINLKNNI